MSNVLLHSYFNAIRFIFMAFLQVDIYGGTSTTAGSAGIRTGRGWTIAVRRRCSARRLTAPATLTRKS